jgi:hypothetical protein
MPSGQLLPADWGRRSAVYDLSVGVDGLLYTILVSEWMDKHDLAKDIANRKKNEFPWKEEYIRAMLMH